MSVRYDGSYRVRARGSSETLKHGSPEQCFIVVQHPGGDGLQDVIPINETWIRDAAGSEIDLGYGVQPAGCRRRSCERSQSVQHRLHLCPGWHFVMKEEAPWIGIDAIGDKTVGSTFTITGTTNLAAGEECR